MKQPTESEKYAKRVLDKIRGSSSDPEMWKRVSEIIADQYKLISDYRKLCEEFRRE